MNLLKKFKTSDRVSITFVAVNILSMMVLLLVINIMYFYLWYEDQKGESHYDMNVNYNSFIADKKHDNFAAFQDYILQKNTIIIPEDGELMCSEWVGSILHNNQDELEKLNDSYFYKYKDKIYFIFAEKYEWIWEVKVLFDTTQYIKSQIMIIKVSLIVMILSIIISYAMWKLMTAYVLRDLKTIAEKAENIDTDNFEKFDVHWCKWDEICILANTINNSFVKINQQTSNLKQFITDVSHEFKTPLMVINSKIDLYRKLEEKWKATPEELDKLLTTIKQRTKKLNNILETLFVFSRKLEGIDKIKSKDIDMSNYIPTYIDDYIANSSQDIEIEYNITKSVIKSIDIELFNIIIDNLLSNAIKFSWNEKIIKIGLTDDQFYIKDNGPGIDKDNLEKIWGKFYRQDTNIEGFWVWLFLVKRVTEVFNWKINVLSQKWKGAKFIIQF